MFSVILDQGAYPIDAAALGERAPGSGDHFLEPAEWDRSRVNRLAPGGLLPQFRHVHVAEIGQHKRARDRRRCHYQHVDRFAFPGQREPLVHTEPMLFVDHGEREIAKFDLVLE